MKNPRRRNGRTEKRLLTGGRATLGRQLRAEALEQRQLLAGDVISSPHQNSWYALDVNTDLQVTPMDALIVLNELNRGGVRGLEGEAVAEARFVDVNGDNTLTALDALKVINALNRGEGTNVPVVEVMLDLTDDQGNSLVNDATRTANISVGQIVNLEVLYTDARNFGEGIGLFTVYTDIITSQAGLLEPVLTESQILSLSENFLRTTGGSVTLTQAGSSVVSTIPANELVNGPAAAIRNALIDDFGYTEDQIFTFQQTREAGDPFDIFVRFLGDEFVGQDIPDFTINASGLTTNNGTTVEGTSNQVNPRLADGSVNPAALALNLDSRSRTGNGAVIYSQVLQGSFNDDPTDMIPDGFLGLGATGPLNANGIPAILGSSVTYDPDAPFEAFSIRVQATEQFQNLQLNLGIPLRQGSSGQLNETELLVYGNIDPGPPAIPGDSRGLLTTEVTVDVDGRIIINAVDRIATVDDSLVVNEDGVQTIQPLTNDDNLGTDPLTIIGTSNASNGTVTFTSTSVTYRPASNYFGDDSFTYRVRNADGDEAVGTVNVTVNSVNDAPTAQNFSITVIEGETLVLPSTEFTSRASAGPANENQQPVLDGIGTASRGTATFNQDRSVTYRAPVGAGSDSFTYRISDGIDTVTATVSVVVTANTAPVAVPDDLVVDELTVDEPLDVLVNDSAGQAGEVSQTIRVAQIVTQPTNGTARISADGLRILYTPNDAYIGPDTLTYRIEDSLGLQSQPALVEIDVVPLLRPRARNDQFSVAEDSGNTTLDVTANDLANDGATVELRSVDPIPAAQGTVTQSGNSVVFRPADDFFGEVTFTYNITDSSDPDINTPEEIASARGTVTVTVTPVNDPPIFNPDSAVPATEDVPVTIAISTLLANDSPGRPNESDQMLTVTAVANQSANGGSVTLSGQSIVYVTRADYNGDDSFTYTISDGAGGTVQGVVSLSIAAVNDPPVLTLGTGLTAAEDVTATFTPQQILGSSRPGPATATDESGQTLQVVSVGTNGRSELNGTVTLENGQIRYRSALNYFGSDSFAVTVRDSGGAESIGTVTLTVTPVNDAPIVGDPPLIAFNKSVATYTTAQLLAASTVGPPNETGTLTLVSASAITGSANNTVGSLSFNAATGTVTYTPVDGFEGTDQFRITISDGELTTTGIVTIDVREFEPSTVRGSIFVDLIESLENPVRNGVHDPNEAGLEMASVRLISSAADNVTGIDIDVELMTDSRGDFEFTNVPPGVFQLRFDLPIMAIDGTDFAGTRGDSDSLQNQFTFEIQQPGGQIAEDYNFTLFGFTGRAGSSMDLMVSNYLYSNPDLNQQSGGGAMGARALLDSTGMQQWFSARGGFEDVRYGEINVNQAGDIVSLTVVTNSGDILTGIVPAARRIVVKDPTTGQFIVHIFGSVESMGLRPDGSVDESDTGLLRYQDAVDALLAQDGSVI